MIHLKKLALPPEIQKLIQANIDEFTALKVAGEVIPKSLLRAYNTQEIKRLLKQETNCKCAYCESKMLHVDYGDIEHITPKGDDPTLRYSYNNLTLACGVCNTNKSVHLDILDPYRTDPKKHLFAFGSLIFRRPHSDEGSITERKLDLNRVHLVEKRQERLKALQTMADQIVRTIDISLRQLLIDEFDEQCSEKMEYSLVANAYAEQIRLDFTSIINANYLT